MPATALIAIDWGTTSARAYCLDAARRRDRDARGAAGRHRRCRTDAFPRRLPRCSAIGATRPRRGSPAAWSAAGRAGSRRPTSSVPRRSRDPRRGNRARARRRAAIVPGVRTRDANGVPDVMRGEETQIAGAVDEREERVLAVLPGTHSKWALVERGQLVDFSTYMTGEMYNVLLESQHPRPAGAAAAGAGPGPGVRARRDAGPGRRRIEPRRVRRAHAGADGRTGADDVPDWLSGLLIGREMRNARAWAQRKGCDGAQRAAGRRRRVAARVMLTRWRRPASPSTRAPADAAALGLWRIAQHASLSLVLPH